jgi:hypothetical protein
VIHSALGQLALPPFNDPSRVVSRCVPGVTALFSWGTEAMGRQRTWIGALFLLGSLCGCLVGSALVAVPLIEHRLVQPSVVDLQVGPDVLGFHLYAACQVERPIPWPVSQVDCGNPLAKQYVVRLFTWGSFLPPFQPNAQVYYLTHTELR